MHKSESLLVSLLRFYLRLIGVGTAAALVVAGAWSLLAHLLGYQISPASLSNGLFTGAVLFCAITYGTTTSQIDRVNRTENWMGGYASGKEIMQTREHRTTAAWYLGAAAAICFLGAVLVYAVF